MRTEGNSCHCAIYWQLTRGGATQSTNPGCPPHPSVGVGSGHRRITTDRLARVKILPLTPLGETCHCSNIYLTCFQLLRARRKISAGEIKCITMTKSCRESGVQQNQFPLLSRDRLINLFFENSGFCYQPRIPKGNLAVRAPIICAEKETTRDRSTTHGRALDLQIA